jgi:thioredoxin reductase
MTMKPDNKIYDALIVGAGPAGVSCAIWLARLGFFPAVVEAAPEVGGLCRANPYYDIWNACLPGMTGPEVAGQLALSLKQAGVPLWLSSPVSRIDVGAAASTDAVPGAPTPGAPTPGAPFHIWSGGEGWKARHVVLATGVRARSLPDYNPETASPAARRCFLIGPGAHVMKQDFRRKRVAVLGGGDNAFENALYAIDHGAHTVHVYARNVRAQHQLVRQLDPQHLRRGDYRVDVEARTVNEQRYDLIMVFYGWEPCAEFVDSLGLQRTAQGFIDTDVSTAETSQAGIYAAGEVAQRLHPCVVTALADGVTVAKAIQARIETANDVYA